MKIRVFEGEHVGKFFSLNDMCDYLVENKVIPEKRSKILWWNYYTQAAKILSSRLKAGTLSNSDQMYIINDEVFLHWTVCFRLEQVFKSDHPVYKNLLERLDLVESMFSSKQPELFVLIQEPKLN